MSLLITFEGIEGSGKTTQIRLVKEYLDQRGIPSRVVREPGGTLIGNRIRQVLLDPQVTTIGRRTEVLLYAASRAQLVEEVIIPSLKENQLVLCDRYVDSSIAYQGYGAGAEIDEVIQINQIATKGVKPQRTYLLDLPLELSDQRLRLRGKEKDRMEQKEKAFHQRVREGYLQIAEENQDRVKVIAANQSVEQVFQKIVADLLMILKENTIIV